MRSMRRSWRSRSKGLEDVERVDWVNDKHMGRYTGYSLPYAYIILRMQRSMKNNTVLDWDRLLPRSSIVSQYIRSTKDRHGSMPALALNDLLYQSDRRHFEHAFASFHRVLHP
jgi:hypothetical protein